MDKSIIKATVADIPELVKLVNRAYRGDEARGGWTHEADLIDGSLRVDAGELERLMQKTGTVVLKGVSENRIRCSVYLEKKGADLYLGMLSVDPGLQGSGWGKRLLAAAEEVAMEQGCNAVIMTVISVRKELIDWYGRHGYLPTGDTEPFPDDPRYGVPRQNLEFVVLRKKLVK